MDGSIFHAPPGGPADPGEPISSNADANAPKRRRRPSRAQRARARRRETRKRAAPSGGASFKTRDPTWGPKSKNPRAHVRRKKVVHPRKDDPQDTRDKRVSVPAAGTEGATADNPKEPGIRPRVRFLVKPEARIHAPDGLPQERRATLERYYPSIEFIFPKKGGPLHGHPISAFGRRFAERNMMSQAYSMLKELRRRDAGAHHAKILDVGSSPRLLNYPGNKFFHCTEPGGSAGALSRTRIFLRSRADVSFVQDGVEHECQAATCDRISFCQHKAEECTCVGAALATGCHSLYYLSPAKIAEVVDSTELRTGLFVIHDFPDPSGDFYGGESKYMVQGIEATMWVKGNNIPYKHSSMRWLNYGDHANLRIGKGRHAKSVTLYWKYQLVDEHTRLYTFMTEPTKGSVISESALQVRGEPISKKFAGCKAEETGYTTVHQGPKFYTFTSDKGRDIIIPRSMIEEGGRNVTLKELNQKTQMSLRATLRTMAQKDRNLALAAEIMSDPSLLLRAANHAYSIIIQRTVAMGVEAMEPFKTAKMKHSIDMYNKLQDWSIWVASRWPLTILMLSIAILTCLVKGVVNAIYGVVPYYQVAMIAVTVTTLILLLRNTRRASLLYHDLTRCGRILYILVFILLFFIAPVMNEQHPFDEILATYHIEHRTLEVTAHSPVPPILNGFESECVIGHGGYLVQTQPSGETQSTLYPKWKIGSEFVLNGGGIDYGAINAARIESEPKPQMVMIGPGFTCAAPVVAAKSENNLIVSIATRAMIEVPEGTEQAWAELAEHMDGELDMIHADGYPAPRNGTFVPATEKEYSDHLTKRKRDARARFKQKFKDGYGYKKGRLCYGCFIKREKMMLMTPDGCTFDRPRMIQGSSPLVKMLAALWFYNYGLAMKLVWHIENWIWYCSAATTDMFNYWIAYWIDKLGSISDIVFVFTDFSKYDVTQGPLCIQREVNWYKKLNFIQDVEHGADILQHKLVSTCYSGQHMFSREATRKSGDLDTSSGNTKNTAEAVGSFLKKHGLKGYSAMAVLGDDNFSMVSRTAILKVFPDLESFRVALINHMTLLGYKVKVGLTRDILEAEFLSSRFWPTLDGFRFGKKPGRVLTKIGYMLHHAGRDTAEYLRQFAGTLISYLPTANHVPFLRVYIQKLLKYMGVQPKYGPETRFRTTGSLSVADSETWAAFERLYGLSEADEGEFAKVLDEFLAKGQFGMIDEPMVDHMFTMDFQL